MSVNYIGLLQSAALATHKGDELSTNTKLRLEMLGINPSSVKSESQAQILIAQAEAGSKQNNSGEQQKNSTGQELLRDAKNLAQNVGVSYSDKDKTEDILHRIADRLNTIAQNYPDKKDIVKEYQNKLTNIAQRAEVSLNIQNNIFNNMNMISISNRLILGV